MVWKEVATGLLALAASVLAYGQKELPTAQWVENEIQIDGSIADWPSAPKLYDAKSKVLFGFANDSATIYLCFKVSDLQTQVRALRAGMALELRSIGRPRRRGRIDYPLKVELEQGTETDGDLPSEADGFTQRGAMTGQGMGRGRQPDVRQLRESFKLKQTEMEVKGFSATKGLYPIKNPGWLNVAIDWDSEKNMFYEIAIPLKALLGDKYTRSQLGQAFELRVEVKAIQKPGFGPGEGMGSGGGGMRPRGGMRPGGMGPGGGMGQGGRVQIQGGGPNSAQFSPLRFKQRFRLAFD